jgi:hypothetical protein
MTTQVNSQSKIPWLRIFAEGVAIVASILLAFGIDALWDARSDKLRSERLLQALEQEWTSDLGQLDNRIERLKVVLAAAEEVIDRTRSGAFDLGGDDGNEWWERLFFGIYKPSQGALNALLLNDLNSVVNVELRVAIASWPGVLGEVAPEASARLQIEQFDFRRAMSRVALQLQIESSFEPPDEQMNTTLGVVPPDALVDAMFKDDDVLLALAHRYQISVLYVRQLGEIRAVLASNLALLRAELGIE